MSNNIYNNITNDVYGDNYQEPTRENGDIKRPPAKRSWFRRETQSEKIARKLAEQERKAIEKENDRLHKLQQQSRGH